MNGVEHRIAGPPEADGLDNIPVAVELEDASVFGIVVGTANSDVKETIFDLRLYPQSSFTGPYRS